MKTSLIDSHAHLTTDSLLGEMEGIIDRAKKSSISHIVNICTDKKSLEEGLVLAEKEKWISNVGATTPHDVEKKGEEEFSLFARAAKEKKLVAVGETGLDYHYEHSSREIQKKFLIRYFHLALETNLPVVIHCREAFSDLFSIADREYTGKLVLHCFTGTKQEAERVLERGWMISFSGIVSFKKSDSLREVAKIVPLERMLIETDAPYLAPQSKRGQVNEPSFLWETAKTLAEVKSCSLEELAESTTKNAKDFFDLD